MFNEVRNAVDERDDNFGYELEGRRLQLATVCFLVFCLFVFLQHHPMTKLKYEVFFINLSLSHVLLKGMLSGCHDINI